MSVERLSVWNSVRQLEHENAQLRGRNAALRQTEQLNAQHIEAVLARRDQTAREGSPA